MKRKIIIITSHILTTFSRQSKFTTTSYQNPFSRYRQPRILGCSSSPCTSNGVCQSNSNQGDYTCICQPGYEGTNCETDKNECASQPCQNNANCIRGVIHWTCWTGWKWRFSHKILEIVRVFVGIWGFWTCWIGQKQVVLSRELRAWIV